MLIAATMRGGGGLNIVLVVGMIPDGSVMNIARWRITTTQYEIYTMAIKWWHSPSSVLAVREWTAYLKLPVTVDSSSFTLRIARTDFNKAGETAPKYHIYVFGVELPKTCETLTGAKMYAISSAYSQLKSALEILESEKAY